MDLKMSGKSIKTGVFTKYAKKIFHMAVFQFWPFWWFSPEKAWFVPWRKGGTMSALTCKKPQIWIFTQYVAGKSKFLMRRVELEKKIFSPRFSFPPPNWGVQEGAVWGPH
jgi:hypothetical protein